jgi:NPCBM-associated, NEW3 domain of alpha-galactosidase
MSGKAEAGTQASISIIITNEGSAPADGIELSGSGPSGWKVEFEPKTVERVAPGQRVEVQALVTPSTKSLANETNTSTIVLGSLCAAPDAARCDLCGAPDAARGGLRATPHAAPSRASGPRHLTPLAPWLALRGPPQPLVLEGKTPFDARPFPI